MNPARASLVELCTTTARCLALLSLTLGFCACHSERTEASASDAPLVRVGQRVLTLNQLQTEVDRMSAQTRAKYATPSEQLKFTEQMVAQEVLTAEAERLGYRNDPEVKLATERAMVLKLVKEKVGTGPEPGEVTEAAMRRYYAEHPSEFGPPERARVAILLVKDGAKAHQVWTEAERAVALGTAGPSSEDRFKIFADLVKKYTEEPGARDVTLSLHLGGSGYPEPVLDAAAAMSEVGGLSPLIDTPDGHYILQLKERIPGFTKPFEEVRGHAARAVSEQLRDRKLAELVAQLEKQLNAHVFEDRFASVRFDAAEGERVAAGGPPSTTRAAR